MKGENGSDPFSLVTHKFNVDTAQQPSGILDIEELSMKRLILKFAMTLWCLTAVFAAEADPQKDEKMAIRQAVESYVAAFNGADAKALAAMWSPEAVYTNPLSGVQVVGRDAIEQQFAGIFADSKGAKLEATTNSIDFISPGVAVESGSAKDHGGGSGRRAERVHRRLCQT